MAKMGRPTKYRESLARAICLRLMLGQSLNEICRLDRYPAKVTVCRWLASREDFCNQYARAREIQQEHYLDETIEIADDGSNDWMERTGKDGECIGYQVNGEHVSRSKLRIETRRWIMERLAAKKYGSKQAIDHTSSDGSMTPSFASMYGKPQPEE